MKVIAFKMFGKTDLSLFGPPVGSSWNLLLTLSNAPPSTSGFNYAHSSCPPFGDKSLIIMVPMNHTSLDLCPIQWHL